MNATADNSSAASTHDKDLVQLAGFHAYRNYKKTDIIEVNGKEFLVEHTLYATKSGLDALTVRNINTGKLTIVFVGSQQLNSDWLGTNTYLTSYLEPPQMIEAKKYFKDVTDNLGEVSSVTGNSLAGAHANAVGIENANVKVVTLNPAMLPGGMFDTTKKYSNITN
jgi:hypothetical protein